MDRKNTLQNPLSAAMYLFLGLDGCVRVVRRTSELANNIWCIGPKFRSDQFAPHRFKEKKILSRVIPITPLPHSKGGHFLWSSVEGNTHI